MNEPPHASDAPKQPPRWQPIPQLERRILGVLVEKAKTTPDAYPMSLNALRAGCNQKNNRDPLMDIELEALEDPLSRLRSLGAVAEVIGGGRVSRYRHYMYDWLGVDKAELAVMTELLLRGVQSEGELRGRAARMEPIADLQALRPILVSLKAKGLIIPLTPEGRGHVLTHALYEPRELERLRQQFANYVPPGGEIASAPIRSPSTSFGQSSVAIASTRPAQPAPILAPSPVAAGPSASDLADRDQLRSEIAELRSEVADLRRELDELATSVRQAIGELMG